MSSPDDGEEEFWNTSDVKAFNFDDEDQFSAPTAAPVSTTSSSAVKTLGSVLAVRSPTNEPFLKPSVILCNGRNKVEFLIEYLDGKTAFLQTKPPKQDPRSYITDIVNNGTPLDFSPYKSKRDKLMLLDCAICCCDGNTITAVTIFLSKTLKQSIFIEELKKRPTAVDHYLHYLEIAEKTREAMEFAAAT